VGEQEKNWGAKSGKREEANVYTSCDPKKSVLVRIYSGVA
jgi:hypothetical protein